MDFSIPCSPFRFNVHGIVFDITNNKLIFMDMVIECICPKGGRMKIIDKVGAFIIRQRSGTHAELLLFTHVDHPDAPIQIPGGTIEAGEVPAAAAVRELFEESGAASLPLIRELGVSEVPSIAIPGTVLRRHCYLFDGISLPESWIHTVTGEGEDQALRFEYRWYSIGRDFSLCGDLGYFLNAEAIPELYERRSIVVMA